MKKPYYYQRGEDYEPEFIGFADDFNGALDLVDKNEIYEMSAVDEMDEDMYLSLRGQLDDEDVKELDKFFDLETPLEALKKIKQERYTLIFEKCFPHDHCPNFDLWFEKECCKDLDLIETALKRLNYIDENKIYCISENYQQDIKKIKAFEIIDNKDIDIWLLKNCDYDNYCRIRTKALETNVESMVDSDEPAIPLPTKEEFDFVKGILK